MPADTPDELRAQQIRLFTVWIIFWCLVAGIFAVLELTTSINGFAGAVGGLGLVIFGIGVVLWLRHQKHQANR